MSAILATSPPDARYVVFDDESLREGDTYPLIIEMYDYDPVTDTKTYQNWTGHTLKLTVATAPGGTVKVPTITAVLADQTASPPTGTRGRATFLLDPTATRAIYSGYKGGEDTAPPWFDIENTQPDGSKRTLAIGIMPRRPERREVTV